MDNENNYCITKEGKEAEELINVVAIAMLCHQLNKEYCDHINDKTQLNWEDAPEWQRESAIKGVAFHLDNPFAGPEASHESWMAEKEANGWVYGETKDPEKKEHPCMVPYEELPEQQQMKDYLFKAVVDYFRNVFLPPYQGYAELDSHRKDVQANKQLRKDGDEIIQKIKQLRGSAERTLAKRKFQEGVMWLGMDLKRLNEPNPYPSSKDASTGDKIEPTADGLEL